MNEYTSIGDPEHSISVRSRKEKWCEFLRERKKALIFIGFRYITLGFDIFSISKKIIRGHIAWGIIVALLLLFNGLIGSMYSLYCHISDKILVEEEEEDGRHVEDRPLRSEEDGYGMEINQAGTVDDDLKSLGSSTDSEPDAEQGQSKKGKKKKSVSVGIPLSYMTPEKPKPEMRGTVIDPTFASPKGDDSLTKKAEISTYETPSRTELCAGFKKCSLKIKIFHCLTIFPKECAFYESSKELLKYLSEPYNKQALDEIDNNTQVKRVCFEENWNQYCYKELMRKQLSLLMAVALTVPMIFVELMYWSWSTRTISTGTDTSFLDISANFNIAELISLLLNVTKVSYRLVSLMNQDRKLNFEKEDMSSCHSVYLVLVYVLFLISRVVSLYSVMMLNTICIIFTCFILVVQLTMSLFFTLDLVKEGNMITSVVSNAMMLFLYVPPSRARRLSSLKYYITIGFEMAMLLILGWYHIDVLGEEAIYARCANGIANGTAPIKKKEGICVLGFSTDTDMFYYLNLASVGMFILFLFLNSAWLSKKLFIYGHPTIAGIKKELSEVNKKFKTDYKLLRGELIEQRANKSHHLTVF